jgi:hypothetical protein
MSSTNRGAARNEADFYVTPEWAVNTLLDNFEIEDEEILEPCAGDGAIIRALVKRYGNKKYYTAIEIRDEHNNLLKAGVDRVYNQLDFLKIGGPVNPKEATIITNPPYSIAQEIIEHCFELYPEDDIVMLLRLNFLGSQRRREFWEKHPVKQIYVLSKRPSFTAKGTDSCEYAWFVWSEWRKPLIKVI